MPCALDGILVIDLSRGAAAALATMFLADHGARVLRLVSPGARHLREGGFVVWDRGKTPVVIDLEAALAGREEAGGPGGAAWAQFLRLIAAADVLIEDLAPCSPMQRLVDRALLRRHNPRLVSCAITAYGRRGPWRDEPPIDELILARTGLLAAMPGFRPAPVHVVHPLPTVGAALLAAIGIAAALFAREATGRGRPVETSLLAGSLLYQTKVSGERLEPQVFQTHPSGSAPFYSVYRCADGAWVQLGCVHSGFVATAARVLGIAELAAEPRFNAPAGRIAPEDEAELRAKLAEILQSKPFAEWAAAFEAADVPFAPARLTEEALNDPQVQHNGMLTTLEDPVVGPAAQMGIPVRLTGTPGRIAAPRAATALAAEHVLVPAASAAPPAAEPHHMASTAAGPEEPPLAGIRILEITNLIAGPTTGRILADLGADVIKLEPPAGDISRPIARSYFYSVNFNKRSVCVDSRTGAGMKVVQRLAATADALVANLRPHATERMGLGPALHPRLIETHLTGYGWTGPYAKRPGIDPLAQALIGLERAQGGPDNPPVFPAQLAPTDYTAGAMGAFGTVLALFARARTGIVQRVECDLLSGGIVLSSQWFTRYRDRPERPLADKEQYGFSPFHRLYPLRDGWIYLAADSEDARRAVCALFDLPLPDAQMVQEARTHPLATPFAGELARRLAERGIAEVLAALKSAGVPASEVRSPRPELFLDDPHAVANDMVADCQHPHAGRLRVAWQLVGFPGTRPRLALPTPLLGEHSAEVLRQIGMDEDALRALVAEGAVRTARA